VILQLAGLIALSLWGVWALYKLCTIDPYKGWDDTDD
jgi:hypothetical protein